MQINEQINEAINDYLESDELKNQIKNEAKKFVNQMVETSLRSYGETGKAVSKKLDESLLNGAKGLNFDTLADFVVKSIQSETIKTHRFESITSSTAQLVNDKLQRISAEKLNLSEIVEEIKKSLSRWNDDKEEIEIEITYDEERIIEILITDEDLSFCNSIRVLLVSPYSLKGEFFITEVLQDDKPLHENNYLSDEALYFNQIMLQKIKISYDGEIDSQYKY